jgi:hypothetical protein
MDPPDVYVGEEGGDVGDLYWGQDLKRLARYTETHDVQPLCLAYFGTANPNYYGIRHTPLPPLPTADDLKTVDCVAAVSVQYLYASAPRSASTT